MPFGGEEEEASSSVLVVSEEQVDSLLEEMEEIEAFLVAEAFSGMSSEQLQQRATACRRSW